MDGGIVNRDSSRFHCDEYGWYGYTSNAKNVHPNKKPTEPYVQIVIGYSRRHHCNDIQLLFEGPY